MAIFFDLEARFVETIILFGPYHSRLRSLLIKSPPVPIPQHSLSMDYIYDTTLGETLANLHLYMLREAPNVPKSQNWS